ncbi:MAG: uroporphyrinogen-III synthase [Pseudomonadota bacterium]
MKRVLVTRPLEDAAPLAERLRERGYEVLIEPMFDIRPVEGVRIGPGDVEISDVQALLFTSVSGVRAFAALTPRRDLQVFTVGDASAAAAREAGFTRGYSAGGDVNDLARVVIERLKPGDGPLLHAAGSALAGDLAGTLAAAGFEVHRVVLYRAEPVAGLSPAVSAALAGEAIDAVLLFSPRTASIFVGHLKATGLEGACRRTLAVGLSPAVVAAADGIPWAARIAALHPDETALLEALAQAMSAPATTPAPEAPAAAAEPAAPPPQAAAPSPELAPAAKAAPPPELAPAATAAPPSAWAVPQVAPAVALALATVAIVWTAWHEFAPGRGDASPVAVASRRLEPQIAALERKLADLGATEAAGRAAIAAKLAALAEPIAALDTRLAEVAHRLAGVDAALAMRQGGPAEAALAAEQARLAGELGRLEAAVARLGAAVAEREAAPKRGTLLLATGQLREAVARGGPFAAELQAVRALGYPDADLLAALAPLEAAAERGLVSRQALVQRLAPVAAEVTRAARRPEGGEWWQLALERAQTLVSIRRVGEVPGDSPAALVARAERALATDDLAGAVEAIGRLPEAAAAPAEAWLADAHRRLASERALAQLAALALAATPR